MNDSITFFIALGIIFVVLRWLLGHGGNDQAHGGATGREQRRLHIVRPEHVQTIQAMFPDIPEAAIRLDLSRTGSPVITSDNILRNGGTLPMPPEARQQPQTRPVMIGETTMTLNSGAGQRRTAGSGATSSGVQLNAAQSPLVNRLRISKDADAEPLPPQPPKVWEADATKRAEVLMKRKEFMLMEARKKFLEKKKQQSRATEKTPAASTSAAAE